MLASARKSSRCCSRRFVRGDGSTMKDSLATVVDTLRERRLFERGASVSIARAPGRLDVMGGIADYSGSLVLEMPIAEATFAAIQKNSSSVIEIAATGGDTSTFEMDLADLVRDKEPLDLASARNFFAERNADGWANYVAGAFFVLCRELGIRFKSGAKVLVASRVPIGKGVS